MVFGEPGLSVMRTWKFKFIKHAPLIWCAKMEKQHEQNGEEKRTNETKHSQETSMKGFKFCSLCLQCIGFDS